MKFKDFIENNSSFPIKNIRFLFWEWDKYKPQFKVIINGEMRNFIFTEPDHEEIVNRINKFFRRSNSPNKTLAQLLKYSKEIRPKRSLDQKPKFTSKAVFCPECEQKMNIDSNPPGTICPNCGEGILEIS
ncbi:MAG: hypothetical protein ACOCV1_00760 [Bacillota bacterium]